MRRRKRFLLLGLLGLIGCKSNNNIVSLPEQIDTFTQGSNDVQSSTFAQRPGVLDILFVVSNAPSMCVKSAKVAAAFSNFLAKIQEAQLDYHIGVVTSDLSQAKSAGHLVKDGAGDTYLTSATPNAAQAFASIIASVGSDGTPDSQPLLAAATALRDPLQSGANAGFLRSAASLAVIVVDDEDDFSLTLPPSDAGEDVGGGLTGDPVGLYFGRLFKSIKGPGQDALVTVSAIAGANPDAATDAGLPTPEDCTAADAGITSSCRFLDNSAHAGTRLFGVVGQTEGLGQSICEQDFGGILRNLGQLLVGLARDFTIATAGQQLLFQTSSLAVMVTPPGGPPQVVPQDPENGWTFDPSAQSIDINGSYVPTAGSTITVTYLELQSTFRLSYPPDPGTLTVQVNGALVPSNATDAANGYDLDLATQSVIFPPSNLPPPGATIVATYQH